MLVLGIILVLVINGVIAHIIGNVGRDKKVGYSTAFWVSFLLSPLIGLLLVIASVPSEKNEIEDNKKVNQISINNYKQLTPDEFEKKEKTEKIFLYVISVVFILFIIYIFLKEIKS